MHPKFKDAAAITQDVIGAAIEVHTAMGPGLLESVYEWCLTKELELRGYDVASQKNVPVRYKHFTREEVLRFDLLINDCLLVDVKATQSVVPIHKAQILSYMKLLDMPLGLVINFNTMRLVDGLSRLMLPGADQGS
ncbi:hypothetical protein Pla123a_03350 [Posidoniimonas polymericola]|uniref:GxxExxY protein n=1 Tax=Posidoniimonas polymericola TaxID=2528002 RepID=A0A5C5ZED8_9BACT|nr:GxxExxY protein [Posidoniimonas polymericola]TWT85528.1 hypothetical protein Pla123a_03350 [Posidoniimonas polymericola]